MPKFQRYCNVGHQTIGWHEATDCPLCDAMEEIGKLKAGALHYSAQQQYGGQSVDK